MAMSHKEVFDLVQKAANKAMRMKGQRQYEMVEAFAAGDVKGMQKYLPMNSRESTGEFNAKPKPQSHVTKEVLQKYLNGLAALPVKRTVKGEELDSYFTKNFDIWKIQSLLEKTGTLAVRPIVQDGEMQFQCFLPYEMVPVTDPRTGKLKELLLTYDNVVEQWTDSIYRLFVDGKAVLDTVNPYNRIPFAIFKSGLRGKGFWGSSDLAAVADGNNNVNLSLTNLLTLANDQSYSVYVITGAETDGDNGEGEPSSQPLAIGPGGAMVLPEGASLQTVTPDASIVEVKDYVNSELLRIKQEAGIVDLGSDYQQGFALKVKNGPYLEKMLAKRRLFEEADARLFELAVLVQEVELTGQPRFLNADYVVKTEFDATALTPVSSQEQNERDKFLIEMNAKTPVDLIMHEYKVNREEAVRIYEQNVALSTPAKDEASKVQEA